MALTLDEAKKLFELYLESNGDINEILRKEGFDEIQMDKNQRRNGRDV